VRLRTASSVLDLLSDVFYSSDFSCVSVYFIAVTLPLVKVGSHNAFGRGITIKNFNKGNKMGIEKKIMSNRFKMSNSPPRPQLSGKIVSRSNIVSSVATFYLN
jgi:hypothetical protein